MPGRARTTVDEVTPPDALAALAADPSAVLVDVRTRAEWAFVGMPDLSGIGKEVIPVEWSHWPTSEGNPRFLDELCQRTGGRLPAHLFFICRSGARSAAAAKLVALEMERRGQGVHCSNVAEGFEGDLDGDRHRGRLNGWKARGLPWTQS